MEKKILIIGSTGMLGHQVLKRFESNSEFSVFDIVYRKKRRRDSIICDVNDFQELTNQIIKIKPQFIVNCVGILIKGSENSVISAIKINSLLPHLLEKLCNKINAKLIHVSTDCVFSGKLGAYSEYSEKDANDIYGKTKALGEVISPLHLTIRTSIVGPELKSNGEGLLNWFLTTEEINLNGYAKVFWSGVTTIELSKVIEFAVKKGISGIWNVTNGNIISKLEMLQIFNEFLDERFAKNIFPSKKKESNKSLKSERFDIGYNVPTFEKMFYQMKLDILANKSEYPHYQGLK